MEMDWLLQNLDAYRIVAEILNELRTAVRRALEAEYGGSWHQDGVPKEVLERLIERKEKEQAIDWHESEYQEITSFAGFVDVLEILQANPNLLPEFMNLASNPALLYARFLELEVITSKLGYARVVGESELSFLGTFHVRFRRALELLEERRRKPPQDSPAAKPEPEPKPQSKPKPVPVPVQEEAPAPSGTEQQAAANPTAAAKGRSEASAARSAPPAGQESSVVEIKEPPDEPPAAAEQQPTPPIKNVEAPAATAPAPSVLRRPPMRPASGANGARVAAAAAQAAEPLANAVAEPEGEAPETSSSTVSRLDKALDEGNSQVILKELYREITSLAEGVWSSEVIPVPFVWNKVCSSSWYEKSFSRLGLKPLSDFYAIINKIDERSQDGASREQLQELLKDNHFAQVLLLLRDMFQRNRV